MSNLDDFDLDLREDETDDVGVSGAVRESAGWCDPDVITSIAYCTRNGQWMSCLCSTCCTGHTNGCNTLGC